MAVWQICLLATALLSFAQCVPPRKNGGYPARGKNGWEDNGSDNGGWQDEDAWQQDQQQPPPPQEGPPKQQQKGKTTPWVGISDIPWNVRVANAQQQQQQQPESWPGAGKRSGNGGPGPWASNKQAAAGWDDGQPGYGGSGPWQNQQANNGAKGWWDANQGNNNPWAAAGQNGKSGKGGPWATGGLQPWKSKNGGGQKSWDTRNGAGPWDISRKNDYAGGWQQQETPAFHHQKKPYDSKIMFKEAKFSQTDYTAPEEEEKPAEDPWAAYGGGGQGGWDQQEQAGGQKSWDAAGKAWNNGGSAKPWNSGSGGQKSWDQESGKPFGGQAWPAGPSEDAFGGDKGWDNNAGQGWQGGQVSKDKAWPSGPNGKGPSGPPQDTAEGSPVNGWLDLQKELYLLKNKVRMSANGGWPNNGAGANAPSGPWAADGNSVSKPGGPVGPWANNVDGSSGGPAQWAPNVAGGAGNGGWDKGGNGGGWQLKGGRGPEEGWASNLEPVTAASAGITHMIFGGPPETASAFMMIRHASLQPDTPIVIQAS